MTIKVTAHHEKFIDAASKLFHSKEHPQDLLGACLWLLREHKTKP